VCYIGRNSDHSCWIRTIEGETLVHKAELDISAKRTLSVIIKFENVGSLELKYSFGSI